MQLKEHIKASTLLLVLYPLYGNKIFISMLSSVAIDTDHIYLAIREKAYTYPKMKALAERIYKVYQADPEGAYKNIFYLFHTVEFVILLMILSLYFPWLKFVALGFAFHIICDAIYCKIKKCPIMRWIFMTEFIRVNLKNSV